MAACSSTPQRNIRIGNTRFTAARASTKAELQTYLRDLLERLAAPHPQQLARQLQYLLEGALSMAHIESPGEQARDAKDAGQLLLKAAGI